MAGTKNAERKHNGAAGGNGVSKPSSAEGATTPRARKRAKVQRIYLPVLENRESTSARMAGRPRQGEVRGELRYRYRFASLLRLSDNLVRKAVSAYDRLFMLESQDEAEIYLDMGREFANDGKLPEALEALRKAAAIKPDDPTLLIEQGALHLRRSAWEAAVQVLQKAKGVGQPSYKTHLYLAEALSQQDKHEAAIEELEGALRLRKDIADIPYRLGVALSRVDRHEEAIDAFELAIELAPQSVAYYQSLGFALESASRRGEAVQCFKRALELEHSGEEAGE